MESYNPCIIPASFVGVAVEDLLGFRVQGLELFEKLARSGRLQHRPSLSEHLRSPDGEESSKLPRAFSGTR